MWANADGDTNGVVDTYGNINPNSDPYGSGFGYTYFYGYTYTYGGNANANAYVHTRRHAWGVDGGRCISLHGVWSGCGKRWHQYLCFWRQHHRRSPACRGQQV